MTTCLTLIEEQNIQELSSSLKSISAFQTLVKSQLQEGQDYGVIPGTQKPTLLKPGAEKIQMLLGVSTSFDIVDKIEDFSNGLFAYTVRCDISKDNDHITSGFGACNSREVKYRYRFVPEDQIPAHLDKQTLQKNRWGKYRIENEEICDCQNTLIKMAKKRAQVDAILTIGSLSNIFTQDLEDMESFIREEVRAAEEGAMDRAAGEDIGSVTINFGKYKGMTLEEIYNKNQNYLEWASKNLQNEKLKNYCALYLELRNSEGEGKDANKKQSKAPASHTQEAIPKENSIDDIPLPEPPPEMEGDDVPLPFSL